MSLQLSDGYICHFGQRLLYYADSLGKDVLGPVELCYGSITTPVTQKRYLLYVRVNTLHYMRINSTQHTQGFNFGKPSYSFQQSWFIKLLVGHRDPLIAAKDECVQWKRRESVQRSTSLQLLNQSWQGSASTDMRRNEENVCVWADTQCLSLEVCLRVCVYARAAGWEADERDSESVFLTLTLKSLWKVSA